MKNNIFPCGKKIFFSALIIFLIIASFFVQTVSAGYIIDYEPKSFNIFLTRGETFYRGITIHNKIDGELYIGETNYQVGQGNEILARQEYIFPYESIELEFYYSTSRYYDINPPGRKNFYFELMYTPWGSASEEYAPGSIYIPITVTIIPEKQKGPLYSEIITPASFDVSVYEGGSAHSILKITGLPSEKLGLAFEPLPYGNGGNSYFGNGGVTKWADSPDGYYQLDYGQETEIRIYYYTTDQISGAITPPGEYDYVFRLYYWTHPEFIESDEFQDYGIIEIPYHLTVLPKSASVPEFPLNPVYAAGLVILAGFCLIIMRGEK